LLHNRSRELRQIDHGGKAMIGQSAWLATGRLERFRLFPPRALVTDSFRKPVRPSG